MVNESEPKLTLKSRMVRGAGAALLGTALGLGIDEGFVNADTPTATPPVTRTLTPPVRTPIPTGTPAPDRLATQVADQRATVTALEEQRRKEKELADLLATATAIQGEINAARGTRTPTPSPTPNATFPAEATRIANLARFQAQIMATATAEAENTATAKAAKEAPPVRQTPRFDRPRDLGDEEQRELKQLRELTGWLSAIGKVGLLAVVGFGFYRTRGFLMRLLRRGQGGGGNPPANQPPQVP